MRNRFYENSKARLWLAVAVWLNFVFCGSYLLAKLYAALMQYLGSPLTDIIYPYFFACLVLPAYFDITKGNCSCIENSRLRKKTPGKR